MKKPIIITIGILLAAAVGFWYFSVNKSQEDKNLGQQQGQLKKIVVSKVSYIFSPSRVVYDVMKDQGFDHKYGLEVEPKEIPTAESFNSLISGSIDIGQINPAAAVLANTQSGPEEQIKIFGRSFIFDISLGVLTNSNINSLEDLKGKKVSVVNPNSIVYSMAQIVFDKLGYDFEKEFKPTFIPYETFAAALDRGEVDAILSTGPNVPFNQMLADGRAKSILSLYEVWEEQVKTIVPYNAFAASDKWLSEHKPEAAAFMMAWKEANDYLLNHLEIVDELVAKENPDMPGEQVAHMKEEFRRSLQTDAWTQSEIDSSQEFIKQLIEIGALPENSSPDIFVAVNN